MMNKEIYKEEDRSFLNKSKHDLSSVSWEVTLTDQYLDATFDLNDGDKALCFSGFVATDGDISMLDDFKRKIMNLHDNLDNLLYALEKAEKKFKKLNGKTNT